MNRVSVAALRIVYEAVFAAEEFPDPKQALDAVFKARSDANDLFAYATAISGNEVCDGAYYERLSSQLRQVILERDLARLTVRHNASCKAIPNGCFTQLIGRHVRVKVQK